MNTWGPIWNLKSAERMLTTLQTVFKRYGYEPDGVCGTQSSSARSHRTYALRESASGDGGFECVAASTNVPSPLAEIELLLLAVSCFREFNITVRIGWNNPDGLVAEAQRVLLRELGLEETCFFDPALGNGDSANPRFVFEIAGLNSSDVTGLGYGERIADGGERGGPAATLTLLLKPIMERLGSAGTASSEVAIYSSAQNLAVALLAAEELRGCGIAARLDIGLSGRKPSKEGASERFHIVVGADGRGADAVTVVDARNKSEAVWQLDEALHRLAQAIL
ncbi:hypothetical protein ACFSL6_21565 [Paenibacillus thailandensis]|uniref:Uncharacterized protein n=1 Tax=Paenibacillus thailandensis TaxID=393250 RepID=A0ABW5R3P1_9BACL